ncbi:MAG: PBP1A family penicillin-binding protein [Myxococcota bacterium]
MDPSDPEADTREMVRWRRLVPLYALGTLGLLGLLGTLGLLFVINRELPSLNSLADYDPPQATVVYGDDGSPLARFATERRTVVPFDVVPQVMVDAVVAAEDADFFDHKGVDYIGILRCLLKNALAGRKACGGSTITQQTVKTFLLSPEKTYTRKLKELVLAKRLEEALSKQDILFLYLNQIYFGHGAYGIQEAARVYFGIDVESLQLEQAALLAGLPKSPSRLDPYAHAERARERRSYVLGRMEALGMIDEVRRKKAEAAPLALDGGAADEGLNSSSHYAAHVRSLLDARFGAEALTRGLSVQVGARGDWQAAAETALEKGLRELDKRRGWRGPLAHVETPALPKLRQALKARLTGVDFKGGDVAVWDLKGTIDAEKVQLRPLREGEVFGGLVMEVDAERAVVDLGGAAIELPFRPAMTWARPFRDGLWSPPPRKATEVLSVGDVVEVEVTELGPSGRALGRLEQTPEAEGAVVVIDPDTREVRALVGGRGLGAGRFNRATQAKRQPGSTFKPFVYAAAFATRRFTPVSRCLDAPRVYRDPWTGRSWKPENYGGRFDGDISLRRALTLSKNLCSVELIDRVGVDPVIAMARAAGIASPLPKSLTLALGAGEVTPLELVNAYATLADGGLRAEPIFIRRVLSANGDLLFEDRAEPEQALPPGVAFQVTSLMESVVEEGTARAVRSLGRPVAGKTGTTNEARDAWFAGFTPDTVAGVWIGFDDNRPLGPSETGGRAAIPVWRALMASITADEEPRSFLPPGDLVFARVEVSTGRLAPAGIDAETRLEAFLPGTRPQEVYEEAVPADRGLWEDY